MNVTDVSIGSINCDPNNADRGQFQLRYIDDVISLNNSRFGDYLHRFHPNEFEVKDTTDTQNASS
jgi:hypothetical protein